MASEGAEMIVAGRSGHGSGARTVAPAWLASLTFGSRRPRRPLRPSALACENVFLWSG